MYVPSAITLIKLYVSFGDTPAAGQSQTITILDNGSSTAMSCSISDPTTASGCTASGSVSVAAGHYLQAQFTSVGGSGSGRQAKVALTFQ